MHTQDPSSQHSNYKRSQPSQSQAASSQRTSTTVVPARHSVNSGSGNPFRSALQRNPFLKPKSSLPLANQTSGHDGDEDYEGEGIDSSQKSQPSQPTKMREIITMNRYTGEIRTKWVPIDESVQPKKPKGVEFSAPEKERGSFSAPSKRGASVGSKLNAHSELGAEPSRSMRESVFSKPKIPSKSPRGADDAQRTKKVARLSQFNDHNPNEISLISPQKIVHLSQTQLSDEPQQSSQIRVSIVNTKPNAQKSVPLVSPTKVITTPVELEITSQRAKDAAKRLSVLSPTHQLQKRDSTRSRRLSQRENDSFETQSPSQFPSPDTKSSPIREFLVEWTAAEDKTKPADDFLKSQPSITSGMRAEMINWIPKLYSKVNPHGQSYHLIVRLMDRALGVKVFPEDKFKLLVVSCIWFITNHYESDPHTIEQFVQVLRLPSSYLGGIERMARFLYDEFYLTMLNSSPYYFLRRLTTETGLVDPYVINVAKYLMDFAVVDYKITQVRPSLIATASLYIAQMIFGKPTLNPALVELSGYQEHHVIQIGCFIVDFTMTHHQYHYIDAKHAHVDGVNIAEYARHYLARERATLIALINHGYQPPSEPAI